MRWPWWIEFVWRHFTDRKVHCAVCGTPIGYVVRRGHRDWIHEDCDSALRVRAI